MDETVYAKVVEALTQVGADEVMSSTRWTARFGERTVEIISDAGPVFPKRYSARAADEAGMTVSSGVCATITGALGSVPWQDLLLE